MADSETPKEEIVRRLGVDLGEKSYTPSGRLEGIHVGGGVMAGPWQCSKGHMVPATHSGCPTCSKIFDEERAGRDR